ncbi:MAG: lactate utilization protein, partial [Oscillospiraceae bacterium]|nr:lactate utilization protein [Oscillospiraceae bacterium]
MPFTKVSARLKELGYKVSVFDTSAEATAYLNSSINGKTVGFGGSVTLTDMGLFDSLSENNTVYWHHHVPEGSTPDEMRAKANSADVYLSSVNGLAETGEIINIDGACNRISSVFYGHEKVILVVGVN